ncbi:hypothetical protein SAMN05444959_1298 [Paracoccus seriniphilus]|uniref:Uncharacterized protein n=2 Tax=Paracoccus seriniphilus TaxID=184748 RepID=A0A239Q2H2_9RHOB|nr:hypothetical protein SAMN05444959_1298 [Paracoccus seriniphilus]
MSDHLRKNSVARRSRYRFAHRFLRRFFSIGTFGRFVGLYIFLDVALVVTEGSMAKFAPEFLSNWPVATSASAIKESLRSIASYLIAAQVGVLGVISMALALITLIAQRESSSTDVKVYYHESFCFEVVASSIALLAILCAQLFWPVQAPLFWLGLDHPSPIFEAGLLGFHLSWLLLNLAGLAHFITTTFGFVQQSEREFLRNRYTANVVQPMEMTTRLRRHFYSAANTMLDGNDENADEEQPRATFGSEFGTPYSVELTSVFSRPKALRDVRMTWVLWALRRWAARCTDAATKKPKATTDGHWQKSPKIWFTPHLDGTLKGKQDWCRRCGGVPLDCIEKFVLRRAFCFQRIDENA